MVDLNGWGRAGWGDGPYGQPAPVEVTGVSATSSLGTTSFRGDVTVVEDKVTGLGLIGDLSTELFMVVRPTGVVGTATPTTPDILADANTGISGDAGVSGTTSVGTVDAVSVAEVTSVTAQGFVSPLTITGTGNVTLTGEVATFTIGDYLIIQKITGFPTGQEGTGETGTLGATGTAVFDLSSVEGLIAVGAVVPFAGARGEPTGQSATGEVDTPLFRGDVTPNVVSQNQELFGYTGSLAITGGCNVYLTSVTGTGEVSAPIIWNKIVPSVTTTWNEVAA